MHRLKTQLQQRRAQHLYRARRVAADPQGPRMRVDGRDMLVFCANDYLGLAADPRIAEAMQRGAARYGVGSGSAHLVSGHQSPHHALEEELADWLGRPRALLYSTGYMANLGLISGLLGPGDSVWEDRLNHASLIDGGLLSRARFKRYAHADAAALARRIQPPEAERRSLIATDGVFSMDGDLAPLPDLARIAGDNTAWLMVDDAHGLGVLGEQGRGSLDHFALDLEQAPILMGTLGKAVGTFGAFVAGEEALIETLIQQSRSYIFTTAMPPALAEATRASVRLVRGEDWRRQQLREQVAYFRHGALQLGLPLMPSDTPIQPLLCGGAERAVRWSARLDAMGILVAAIRPPTVPEGSARLRITLSAAHTREQVDRLLSALGQLQREERASVA